MNITSKEVRSKLHDTFDAKKRFWSNKVSNTALLRDGSYFMPTHFDLKNKVYEATKIMASVLCVDRGKLPGVHTGSNGRFDCDNYAVLGCAISKALHEVSSRYSDPANEEYAIWPMARNDIDHTQALCLAQEGFFVVEFMTGQAWLASEIKPDILMVG